MNTLILIRYLHLFIVIFTILIFTFFQWMVNWLPFPGVIRIFGNHFGFFRNNFSLKRNANHSSSSPTNSTTPNPTSTRTTMELIRNNGYECEQHSVLTKDNYILGIHRLCHETPTTYEIAKTHTVTNSTVLISHHPLVQRLDLVIPNTTTGSIEQKYYALPTLPKRVPSGYYSSSSSTAVDYHHRPPVLLMHGLMMSSEIWVAGGKNALPYLLHEQGFDVWMGNLRGNRYSSKHQNFTTNQTEYWNFSLDEIIRYDIPQIIQYILHYTHYNRLAYIGFSQGSAVIFGALALYPSLQHSLSVCVSLSPAMALRGLSKSPVTTIVSTDTTFLYLIFGKKRMLRIALDIQRILSPSIWVTLVDLSMAYLFGWRSQNIDPIMKLTLYHHLFSLTSVKTIVHWFHIIASQRFEMFTEYINPTHGSVNSGSSNVASTPNVDIASSLRWFTSFRSLHDQQIMPLYDTRMVQTPLAFFVGGADTLIDIEKLLMILPAYSGPIRVPYEHRQKILSQPFPGTKAQHINVSYLRKKQLRSFALASLAIQKQKRGRNSTSFESLRNIPSLSILRPQGNNSSDIPALLSETEEIHTVLPKGTRSTFQHSGGLSMNTLKRQEAEKLNRLQLPFTLPKIDMCRRIDQLNLDIHNSPRFRSVATSNLQLPMSPATKISKQESGGTEAEADSSAIPSIHRSFTLPESTLEKIAKLVRDEDENRNNGTNLSSSTLPVQSNQKSMIIRSPYSQTSNIMSPLSVSSPLKSSSFSVQPIRLSIPSDGGPVPSTFIQQPTEETTTVSGGGGYVYEQHAPFIFQEPTYEHLDYLWATTVKDRAFPSVLLVVDKYRHRQKFTGTATTTDSP